MKSKGETNEKWTKENENNNGKTRKGIIQETNEEWKTKEDDDDNENNNEERKRDEWRVNKRKLKQ